MLDCNYNEIYLSFFFFYFSCLNNYWSEAVFFLSFHIFFVMNTNNGYGSQCLYSFDKKNY